MSVKVQEHSYVAATQDYAGWCKHCEEFTREMTEPDAEGYDCPDCGETDVVGAEQALIMDLISFG